MLFKNTWGTPQSGIDQQRADLFYIVVNYPGAVLGESTTVWDQSIGWTVEEWPFPNREVDVAAIKHGQQSNYQLGGDKALDGIEVKFRYAFNQRTAELLEKWFWLISNPFTGGVGLTSHVKTNGTFYWMVPDMNKIAQVTNKTEAGTFVAAGAYYLEGILLTSLKPDAANMVDGNKFVNITGKLQIDRYYPINPSDLTVTSNTTSVGSIGAQAVPSDLGSQDLNTTF
jgi:hypothetical protein